APFCAAAPSDPTLALAPPVPAGPEPATLGYSGPSLRLKRLPPLDPGRARRRRRLMLAAGAVLLSPLLCCFGVGLINKLFFDRPAGTALKSTAPPSTAGARAG